MTQVLYFCTKSFKTEIKGPFGIVVLVTSFKCCKNTYGWKSII